MGLETAAAIAIGTGIAGTGLSALSSYQQGEQQRQWSEYNAALTRQKAEQNKVLAEANAEKMRISNEELRAKQRFAFGLSGVSMDDTPTDFIANTANKQQLDIATYLYNKELESDAMRSNANIMAMQGDQTETAGKIGAGTSLLSGVSRAASIYGGYKYRTNFLSA